MDKRYYNIKEISQYTGLPVKIIYDRAKKKIAERLRHEGRT